MTAEDWAVAIITGLGRATCAQIQEKVPHLNQRQIMQAIWNAMRKERAHLVGRLSTGRGGQQPGVYAPGPVLVIAPQKHAEVSLASVWSRPIDSIQQSERACL